MQISQIRQRIVHDRMRRTTFSLSPFGIFPYRSNGDKLGTMSKQAQRKSKTDTKTDRKQQTADSRSSQSIATAMKESELRAQCTQNSGEYAPDTTKPTAAMSCHGAIEAARGATVTRPPGSAVDKRSPGRGLKD